MKEHLQPWYDKWLVEHADTNLLYVDRAPTGVMLRQVHFVRDVLALLFWRDVPYDQRNSAPPRDDRKETAHVIGEHYSKSVRLPVYSLERPDLGLQIVLRNNYHDWNVSVISETPVTTDLSGFQLDYSSEEERAKFPNGYLSRPGRCWGGCFFQGFPEEVQFGPFSENPRKFSLCISSEYDVYMFLGLLLRDQCAGDLGGLFMLIQESETRIAVHCKAGMQLRWATLERVETDLEGNKNWIVRRFDWFDPTSPLDPSFQRAVSPNELRELLAILDKLNGAAIKETI